MVWIASIIPNDKVYVKGFMKKSLKKYTKNCQLFSAFLTKFTFLLFYSFYAPLRQNVPRLYQRLKMALNGKNAFIETGCYKEA